MLDLLKFLLVVIGCLIAIPLVLLLVYLLMSVLAFCPKEFLIIVGIVVFIIILYIS